MNAFRFVPFIVFLLISAFIVVIPGKAATEKLSNDVIIIEQDLINSDQIGYKEEVNTLYFGSALEKFLQFDPVKNAFIFSSDVSFGGNEMINMRLENLPIAPKCNEESLGRSYHNTTDTYSYVCDGENWKIIDTDAISNPPMAPFIQSLSPERIGINTTNTIKVTGINFTADTVFTAGSGATINSIRIIDGETAEINVTAGPQNANVGIQAKNGISEWQGNQVILHVSSTQSADDVLLDFNNSDLASYIPNVFPINFDMGTDGATYVNDGGTGRPNENDIYDRGNYISTNLFANIPYTGGRVVANHAAWGGGKYVTSIKNNIFFLIGEVKEGVKSFKVSGNLGADGGGNTNTVKISYGGYDAYIKRVYGAGSDPSVNHMFIVASGTEVTHTASTNTDLDDDAISGLENLLEASDSKFYYILFSNRMGGYTDDATMRNIFAYIVDTVIH